MGINIDSGGTVDNRRGCELVWRRLVRLVEMYRHPKLCSQSDEELGKEQSLSLLRNLKGFHVERLAHRSLDPKNDGYNRPGVMQSICID